MADNERVQEASLRDFLNVVFRRRWAILSILLLTTVSIAYFNTRKPDTYVSSSRILVKRGERGSVFGGTKYLGWAEEVSSEIEIILSKPVFERAEKIFADSVSARNLEGKVAFMPGAVRADVLGESNVFIISASGLDPLACQLTCAAVTNAYKDYYEITAAPPEVSDFFHEEIQDVDVELEVWRQKKADFLNKTQFFGLDAESRANMNKKTMFEVELVSGRAIISQQTVRVEALRRLMMLSTEQIEKQLALSETLSMQQFALLQNVKYTLQRTQMEREELLQRYTKRHPEVVAIDQQIEELRLSLKNEVANALASEESKLNEYLAKQATYERELAAVNARLRQMPNQELELDRIETRIARLESEHNRLLTRKKEAEIAKVSSPQFDVTILTPAGPATARKTTDYVRLALGPMLALIVGLGFAFFLEGLDHSLKNVGEVEQYLGANVLASISEVQEKAS